jgi:hypothetical protein
LTSAKPVSGDRFLESVEQTLERIAKNAEQYQLALLDRHRAPIRPFHDSLWYRILPDESVVVAALSDRRDVSVASALFPLCELRSDGGLRLWNP